VEEQRFEKGALRLIKEHGLGELISQGLNASVGLLSYLRVKGTRGYGASIRLAHLIRGRALAWVLEIAYNVEHYAR
jgi:hypothetical protein